MGSRRLAALVTAGVVIVLAGCSSGVPHRALAALTAGCSTAVAAGGPLAAPKPVTASVPGRPTAVVGMADGRWAFASVSAPSVPGVTRGAITVLALGHGAPRMVRTLMRPDSMPGAYGMAVTRNGLLLVAGYTATVGSEPVGLLLVDDGRLALVCNFNSGTVEEFPVPAAP